MYNLICETNNIIKGKPLIIYEKLENIIYEVENNLNNVEEIYKNSLRSIKNKIKKLNNIYETNNVIFESAKLNDDNIIEYTSNLIYTIMDSIHRELVEDGNVYIINYNQLIKYDNPNINILKEIITEFEILSENYSKINNCRINEQLFYSEMNAILESWAFVDKVKTFLNSLIYSPKFFYNIACSSLLVVAKRKNQNSTNNENIREEINVFLNDFFKLNLITENEFETKKSNDLNKFSGNYQKPKFDFNRNTNFNRNTDDNQRKFKTPIDTKINPNPVDELAKSNNYDSALSKHYVVRDTPPPSKNQLTKSNFDTIHNIVQQKIQQTTNTKPENITTQQNDSDEMDISIIINIAKKLKNGTLKIINDTPTPILFAGLVAITAYIGRVLLPTMTTNDQGLYFSPDPHSSYGYFFANVNNFLLNPYEFVKSIDFDGQLISNSIPIIGFSVGAYWISTSIWRIFTGNKTKSHFYWMYLKIVLKFFVYFEDFRREFVFYLNDSQKLQYQIVNNQFETCLKQSFWSRFSNILGGVIKNYGHNNTWTIAYHPRCPVKMMLDQIYFLIFIFLNDLRDDVDLNSLKNLSEMIYQLNTFKTFKNEKIYELFLKHTRKIEQFEVGLINEVNSNFVSIRSDVVNNLRFDEIIIKYPYSEKYFSNYRINKKE